MSQTKTLESLSDNIENVYHVGWRKGVDGEGSGEIWRTLGSGYDSQNPVVRNILEQHLKAVTHAAANFLMNNPQATKDGNTTTMNEDYFVIGYNVILTFTVGDLPTITDDEKATKKYLKEKLMFMIAHDKYMIELCCKQDKDKDSDYAKFHEKVLNEHIKLYRYVVKHHTVTKEGNIYTMTLPFVGKLMEDRPQETRDYNDGVSIEFVYDALRSIGMCHLMRLKVDVCKKVSVTKYLPKTLEEWEEWDKADKPESDYWLAKAEKFRIVAIPRTT